MYLSLSSWSLETDKLKRQILLARKYMMFSWSEFFFYHMLLSCKSCILTVSKGWRCLLLGRNTFSLSMQGDEEIPGVKLFSWFRLGLKSANSYANMNNCIFVCYFAPATSSCIGSRSLLQFSEIVQYILNYSVKYKSPNYQSLHFSLNISYCFDLG